jgi:hypothetical protein
MSAYVAARWDDRKLAMEAAAQLRDAGIVIHSTWLSPRDDQSMDTLKAEGNIVIEARARALMDVHEIAKSNLFVQLSPEAGFRNSTGGKHVELGIAIALGKTIYIIGQRENVFHYHPSCRLVPTVDAIINSLLL